MQAASNGSATMREEIESNDQSSAKRNNASSVAKVHGHSCAGCRDGQGPCSLELIAIERRTNVAVGEMDASERDNTTNLDAQAQFRQLDELFHEFRSEMENFGGSISQLQQDFESRQLDIHNLGSEIGNLGGSISDLDQDISELGNKITELGQILEKRDNLNAVIGKLRFEVKMQNNKHQDFEDRLDKLMNKINMKQDMEKSSLDKAFSNLIEDIDMLRHEFPELQDGSDGFGTIIAQARPFASQQLYD
ncbi:hypothetical protein HDK64DRAFT_327750 [Phyllosticta capitalensis]